MATENTADLDLKYRPKKLSQFLGPTHVAEAVQKAIAAGERKFLFVGPSGVGKTTLARIITAESGSEDVYELDAATHTGIDNVRENIIRPAEHKSLSGGHRIFIIDEAHKLSKAAVTSLLKTVEDKSSNIFIFCTTETVDRALQTRCQVFRLAPVATSAILKRLHLINTRENLGVSDDVMEVIAEMSEGSPRFAITRLSQCRGLTNVAEAKQVVSKIDEAEGPAMDLVKLIMKCNNPAQLPAILKKARDVVYSSENPTNGEEVRKLLVWVMGKILYSNPDPLLAHKVQCFLKHAPYFPATANAQLAVTINECFAAMQRSKP